MYIQPSTLQNLVPGEPMPDAIHREEYLTHKQSEIEADSSEAVVVDHRARSRATLLRAEILSRVGTFFA